MSSSNLLVPQPSNRSRVTKPAPSPGNVPHRRRSTARTHRPSSPIGTTTRSCKLAYPAINADQHLRQEIGQSATPTQTAALWATRQKILDADARLLACLPTQKPAHDLSYVCPILQIAVPLPSIPRRNIFPSVFLTRTRATRIDLQAYLNVNPQKAANAGMIVVHSGRHPVGNIAAAHRRLGGCALLLARELTRRFGIGVELTATHHAMANYGGETRVNVHMHMIYTSVRTVDCMAVERFIRVFMDHQGFPPRAYCRRLRSIDRAVRYCFQPPFMKEVNFASGELGIAVSQIEGLKLLRPVGNFKKWRKELRPRPTKNSPANQASSPQYRIAAIIGQQQTRYVRIEIKARHNQPKADPHPRAQGFVIARTLPQPWCSDRKTPAHLVKNFCSFRKLLRGRDALELMVNRDIDAWNDAVLRDGKPDLQRPYHAIAARDRFRLIAQHPAVLVRAKALRQAGTATPEAVRLAFEEQVEADPFAARHRQLHPAMLARFQDKIATLIARYLVP